MNEDLFGDLLGNFDLQDDSTGSFYCPYTNGDKCALMTKGWQPQELCKDLECDQLKFVKRAHHRKRKAA